MPVNNSSVSQNSWNSCTRNEMHVHDESGHKTCTLFLNTEIFAVVLPSDPGTAHVYHRTYICPCQRATRLQMNLQDYGKIEEQRYGLVARNVPEYFANSGFDVWKRILTLSRGATTVFACSVHRFCMSAFCLQIC